MATSDCTLLMPYPLAIFLATSVASSVDASWAQKTQKVRLGWRNFPSWAILVTRLRTLQDRHTASKQILHVPLPMLPKLPSRHSVGARHTDVMICPGNWARTLLLHEPRQLGHLAARLVVDGREQPFSGNGRHEEARQLSTRLQNAERVVVDHVLAQLAEHTADGHVAAHDVG